MNECLSALLFLFIDCPAALFQGWVILWPLFSIIFICSSHLMSCWKSYFLQFTIKLIGSTRIIWMELCDFYVPVRGKWQKTTPMPFPCGPKEGHKLGSWHSRNLLVSCSGGHRFTFKAATWGGWEALFPRFCLVHQPSWYPEPRSNLTPVLTCTVSVLLGMFSLQRHQLW